ncbi:hypothetical protein BDB01DRAFT_771102 [Pilobolus umbonatus]|nr:hypothetical protein BDB01DRAFT_771102 [Pilobolus umbonatus]
MTKALFSPIQIGRCQLKHRVVLAPLTRLRANIDAVPNDLMVQHYQQRASPGGLLITEATFIDRLAGGYKCAPGIYNDAQIAGWKKVTDAVHKKGGYIFLQLWHIGRAGLSSLNPNNEPTVSASAIAISGRNFTGPENEVPHALEISEIKEWVQKYKQASINAIAAGFDGVEIHNANGYLLDQFVNSNSNKRTDAYGGSVENRSRFTLEVVDAITAAIGDDRTAIRFSPGGNFQDMADENPVETWSYLTTQLKNTHPKLAYVHFIEPRSNFISDEVNTSDSLGPYRQIWKGHFITAGGFSTATEHAVDIAEKNQDLIAFGRAFIANPDLPERIKNNWPLNKYNRKTFYAQGAEGYTDYPFYSETADKSNL